QGVRHGLYSRASDWHLHGLLGGRVRGLLQLRPLRARTGGRVSDSITISDREQKILGIIETARGKRAKFRDEQITMAHGAGGKATQSLIEGMFVPILAGDTLAEMTDAAPVELGGVGLAFTTDSYVVKPLRFPGGSIGDLAV